MLTKLQSIQYNCQKHKVKNKKELENREKRRNFIFFTFCKYKKNSKVLLFQNKILLDEIKFCNFFSFMSTVNLIMVENNHFFSCFWKSNWCITIHF